MLKIYRTLALFSGGLDSILSVKWMQHSGTDVIPVYFRTPFFTEERALQAAHANGLKIEVIDISVEHLRMLKNPHYGFGKNFNPCIDCHALMFNKAGDLLETYQADFLISGEVLGQRPMSQRRDALNAVGKLSGYRDLLVRPLSQQLLPDTKPIREGWIQKSNMLSIQGRSRRPQLELARIMQIKEIPSPAGGCRLTDVNFSVRLYDLLEHGILELSEIELLKYGRHFRLNENTKLIVGRDDIDNQNLEKANPGYPYLFDEQHPGPLGILCAENPPQNVIDIAASLVAYYNKKAGVISDLGFGLHFPLARTVRTGKAAPELVHKLMIKR